MPSIIFSLVSVFLIHFLIEPTACALPTDLRNVELDDFTSLRRELPSIIDKIKVIGMFLKINIVCMISSFELFFSSSIVNQLQCPKGWRHFGGSCYYLSNTTSTSIQADRRCNLLNSNHSNLMQIRNKVDLFYAVHVLTDNKLSALMIDIDPNLLKGNEIFFY
jgi:hypothetical protein